MTAVPPEFNPETAPPRLEIDWDAYLPFFENEDIPEEQKRDLIEALWGIMVSFVDLGFGIAPSHPACGQEVVAMQAAAEDMLHFEGDYPSSKITLPQPLCAREERSQNG
jgi:hypothetical protein